MCGLSSPKFASVVALWVVAFVRSRTDGDAVILIKPVVEVAVATAP